MIAIGGSKPSAPQKVRRHVFLFKPRFAELVRTGRKVQTIRPPRKRPVHAGDRLSLRMWSGKPYRSKHVWLSDGICRSVLRVVIRTDHSIRVGYEELTPMGVAVLAAADGFANAADMFQWFGATHGLPFNGILISWTPLSNS